MYTFLYCFDNNYNVQAFTSIISLLETTSKRICITIIHSEIEDKQDLPLKIINHPNLSKIEIHKFDDKNIDFPNIEGKHISKATYYRMYFLKYISIDYKYLIYVDSDVIFLNCPISSIEATINKMKVNKYTISAKPEVDTKVCSIEYTSKLKMKSNRYFNAGFLIIDIKSWRSLNVEQKLINIQNELKNAINYWDQDVLNSYFDGNFYSLPNNLNYFIDLAKNEPKLEIDNLNISAIHYIGKTKPWSIKGSLEKNSKFFQDSYKLFSQNAFYITHKMKKLSLIDFLKSIFNLKILNVDQPVKFFLSVIRSFF